jgi:hypothetical protein
VAARRGAARRTQRCAGQRGAEARAPDARAGGATGRCSNACIGTSRAQRRRRMRPGGRDLVMRVTMSARRRTPEPVLTRLHDSAPGEAEPTAKAEARLLSTFRPSLHVALRRSCARSRAPGGAFGLLRLVAPVEPRRAPCVWVGPPSCPTDALLRSPCRQQRGLERRAPHVHAGARAARGSGGERLCVWRRLSLPR